MLLCNLLNMEMLSLPTEIIICFLRGAIEFCWRWRKPHDLCCSYQFLQHEPRDGPGAALSCEDISVSGNRADDACFKHTLCAAVLTDVVGVLLHDVRLQQVIRQHEGPLLHCVQQHGGGPQLLACAQLPPRSLGLRLQQVVDRRHHGLQSPDDWFRDKKLSWAWNSLCLGWFDASC